jgi:hypothetical protein
MRRPVATALLAISLAGCRTPPPPPPRAPEGLRVETSKQDLQITPWELVMSGVRGVPGAVESINVRNAGKRAAEISRIAIVGEQGSTFRLESPPPLPILLPPTRYANVAVAFVPAADATPGVHRATLRLYQGAADESGLPIDLVGLVTSGEQGPHEPTLQQIVEALGFGVNVGGEALALPTAAAPIGDEVAAPRFVRAKRSPVGLLPVARYAQDERVPYGYYGEGGRPTLHEQGAIAAGQAQTLNPELDAEAKTNFDPGDAPFGLYVTSGTQATFSEDRLNRGPTKHAVRVYPLRTRAGQPVPDAFLVAFEETGAGDYQDAVFVLYNVKPVR